MMDWDLYLRLLATVALVAFVSGFLAWICHEERQDRMDKGEGLPSWLVLLGDKPFRVFRVSCLSFMVWAILGGFVAIWVA